MKKLFCKLPFTRISIDEEGYVWPACCPAWMEFPLGNVFEENWEEIWYGENATKFRESMFDGSLRYCNRNWCPNIGDVEAGIENYHVIPHEQSPKKWDKQQPIHVNLNYDQSCNLKCPSCRHDFIQLKGKALERVEYMQNYVEENILPHVESVALTGVGEAFLSKVFRNFLFNFSSEKYPNIKLIHLHTNGQLLDERLFNKMQGIHHLDLSIDISIDAASAEVYDKVRPPGDWNKLLQNLSFIKKIKNLKSLGISMVVQQDNYWEMLKFIELGKSLVYNNRDTFVEFKRPRQYSHLTDEQYSKINLDDLDEKEMRKFSKELKKVENIRLKNAKKNLMPRVLHNLQEYETKSDSFPGFGSLAGVLTNVSKRFRKAQ